MKRNFLKNSLAAFAFSLAIVASFAFSTNESDADSLLIDAYEQSLSPDTCLKVTTVDPDICNPFFGIICTYNGIPLYKIQYEAKTTCSSLLRKAI